MANEPIPVHDTLPIPMADQQRLFLQTAGITPEELGAKVKDAIETAHKKLTAQETRFFSHQGEVVEERMVDDHTTQLSAARILTSIATDYFGHNKNPDGSSDGPITLHFHMNGEEGTVQVAVTNPARDAD